MEGIIKICFLDIDGVLNSQQSMMSQNVKGVCDYEGLDRTGLGLLRKLVELTGAKIVISSTWRHDGHEPIAGAFEACGWRGIIIHKTIIGITPFLSTNRGGEIDDWLSTHPECTNYVIIDDDADMLDSQKDHFVHTDGVLGFTLYDMVKAMDILGVVDDPEKVEQADDLRELIEFKINRRKESSCGYTI